MKHAFFGPGRAIPIPAVFRQPFVFNASAVAVAITTSGKPRKRLVDVFASPQLGPSPDRRQSEAAQRAGEGA